MNITYAQNSSTVQKFADFKASSVLDSSSQSESLQRKADMANGTAQRVETPRPNNTGMPDNLKAGIESLSGFSMDDVRVHYNSPKPATVQALAYTQGTDIHVAPGQEKHLPHEAWHVAQQMAGRVFPTTNINGMPVNDNTALEHEADVMGEKAVQCKGIDEEKCTLENRGASQETVQCEFGKRPYPHIEVDESKVEGVLPQNCFENASKTRVYRDESEFLPSIAFEVMAGFDRIDELLDLYKFEIKRYKGQAYIYIGINVLENVQKDKLDEAVNRIKQNIKPILNYNHRLVLIPFRYKKTVESESYNLPYMEARHLLMSHAKMSDATIFRWIDSDVRDDSSIDEINNNGYAEFDVWNDYRDDPHNLRILKSAEQWKKYLHGPLVYSGFYNWRDCDESVSECVRKINTHEAFARMAYWNACGCCFEQIRNNGGRTVCFNSEFGYIPEPIAYMTYAAHDAAMKNLMTECLNLNRKGCTNPCQQNEARAAFNRVPMAFKSNFSVSKPVKKGYSVCPPSGVLTVDSLKGVRQSAFDQWSAKRKFYELALQKSSKILLLTESLVDPPKSLISTGKSDSMLKILSEKQNAKKIILKSCEKTIRQIVLNVMPVSIENDVKVKRIIILTNQACEFIDEINESMCKNVFMESLFLRALDYIVRICLRQMDEVANGLCLGNFYEWMNVAVRQCNNPCCAKENPLEIATRRLMLMGHLEDSIWHLARGTSPSVVVLVGNFKEPKNLDCVFKSIKDLVKNGFSDKKALDPLNNIANNNPDVLSAVLKMIPFTISEVIREVWGDVELSEENIKLIRGGVETIVEMCMCLNIKESLLNGKIPNALLTVLFTLFTVHEKIKKKNLSKHLFDVAFDTIGAVESNMDACTDGEAFIYSMNRLERTKNDVSKNAIVDINRLVMYALASAKEKEQIEIIKFVQEKAISQVVEQPNQPDYVNAIVILTRELINACKSLTEIEKLKLLKVFWTDNQEYLRGLIGKREELKVFAEMLPMRMIVIERPNGKAKIYSMMGKVIDVIKNTNPLSLEQGIFTNALVDLILKCINENSTDFVLDGASCILEHAINVMKGLWNEDQEKEELMKKQLDNDFRNCMMRIVNAKKKEDVDEYVRAFKTKYPLPKS